MPSPATAPGVRLRVLQRDRYRCQQRGPRGLRCLRPARYAYGFRLSSNPKHFLATCPSCAKELDRGIR